MYTSGSAGKPKGVEISHANIVNYILEAISTLEIKQDDIYLHTASFSFSSSIRQFLTPLVSGIPVYIANEEDVRSLNKILEIAKKHNITIIDSVPSLWKYGLNQIERSDISKKEQILNTALRLLVFSGDLLPAQLVQKIKTVFQDKIKIINVYGQTESIGMLSYAIPVDFKIDSGIVPIGFPPKNTNISVLDNGLNQVKNGDIGELYISSPSIGIGYYKNKELTDQVFFKENTINDSGHKTFKTGDLVRYWENKPLEIIGRTDFQVKIRGVRIDLNEVENVILKYSTVKESIVIGILNKENEQTLIGFVVAKDNSNIDINNLKIYLKSFLPANYIPEKILNIKKIPLSSNGKIDRKQLQFIAENELNPAKEDNDINLRNEVQKTLYNLFVKILNTRDLALTDNFFDIGGHSLKAVELIELLERIYNKSIPVELIYQYPSIEKLAPLIDDIKLDSNPLNLVAINTSDTKYSFICVHGDDANFLIPKYLDNKISFYGYFHQGRHGDRIKFKDIPSISQKYIDELFQIKPEGPYTIGGYSIGGVIAFNMVKILKGMGKKVNLLILIDSESPQYEGKFIPGQNIYLEETRKEVFAFPDQVDKTVKRNHLQSLLKLIKVKSDFFIALLISVIGFKIPLRFRNNYIMGIYRRARKKYFPEIVDVKTVIIRSTLDNFEGIDLGWKRYISGDISIFEIVTDHDNIIKEPYVRKLTNIIQEAILAYM